MKLRLDFDAGIQPEIDIEIMFKISTFNENKSIKQLSKLTKSIKPKIRLAEKANIRPVPLYPGKFVPLYPIPYSYSFQVNRKSSVDKTL